MRRRAERRRAAAEAAAAKNSAVLTIAQSSAAAGTAMSAAADGATASADNLAALGAAAGTDASVSPSAAATTTSTKATKPLMIHPAEQFKLHVHGHEFQNGEELVLNPEYFPQLKELHWADYVVEVFHPRACGNHSHNSDTTADGSAAAARQHLLLEISPSGIVPIRGKLQVSVLRDTAADFALAPFKDVMVRFVAKAHVEVDFVEVSLKDQFMSRRDLWYLKQSIQGAAVYVGKNIRVHGTRWQVMDVRANGDNVASGVISKKTKFAFRSRTSRVMWLVQVSPELWDVANSGTLYLELLLRVVESVLRKWMTHKVSHSLTIIFFARNYYPDMETNDAEAGGFASAGANRRRRASSGTSRNAPTRSATAASSTSTTKRRAAAATGDDPKDRTFPYDRRDYFPIGVDENGRHFQDFYKVVAFDSLVTDVEPLIVTLKQELNAFPHACGWKARPTQATPPLRPSSAFGASESPSASREAVQRLGVPSFARDGNLLEAINLVLNIFEKHHIDRHLARSGQSVVLMTAGNGIFSVNKRLAEITEQRMMDHGIGIDLISLATPPLHKVPLFLFKQSEPTEMKLPSRAGEANAVGDACLCAPAAVAATGATTTAVPIARPFTRRSRTASNDGLFDSQSIADAGGGGAATAAAPPSSMRAAPLCKYCTQRLENRKNYVIPLWIPLCFVEEAMMVDHVCPLDDDITRQCSVCHPLKPTTKDFVPLPMCRMFRDDDRVSTMLSSGTFALPKPLEKLLRGFQDNDSEQETRAAAADASMRRGVSNTTASEFATYNDLLFAGMDSDLVRARAPSIASADDLMLSSNSSNDNRTTRNSNDLLLTMSSPADRTRALLAFDKYDDNVFGFSGSKQHSSIKPAKSLDGNNDRLCFTPPLGPRQPPGSATKLKHRAATASVMTFHSSSAGDRATGVNVPDSSHSVLTPRLHRNQWRPQPRDRSLSPMLPLHHDPTNNGSLSSEPKFLRSSSCDSNDNDDNNDNSDDSDMSSLEFPPAKPRHISGSLPTTYLLDGTSNVNNNNGLSSYAPLYPASPMLRPGDAIAKDDLFNSQAFIFSSKLTSNQRRWSQIRPSEDAKYRLVQHLLKWKSLCFPALLPLTSDFFPTAKELQAHYQQSFYSVTLPERDEQQHGGTTFRDYREFVTEMVAQRFAQDFQLVTIDDSASGDDDALTKSAVFRLSMGHRIHEITFNAETETIDVKRYVQKAKVRSDTDIMEYRYALWSPVTHAFRSVSQEFRKYPRLEYAWNYLDQLICGYYDEMSEAIRYKRILYCIVPPRFQSSSRLDAASNAEAAADDAARLQEYTDRCLKFLEFLRSKAEAGGFPTVAVATDQWQPNAPQSGVDAFKRVFQSNVKIPVTAADAPTSQNWVLARVDLELLATQCYHLEVQWLVCRSALVDDFITAIVRRAKQLGLELLQVPENGVTSNLDLHPMICPIFLPVAHPREQALIEAALIDELDFCCEALHPIPFTHLNHGDAYALPVPEPRVDGRPLTRRVITYYRQYVHRSLPCYVRMTQTGIVWISNRKLPCPDIQAIFDGLQALVTSVGVARVALEDVIERVFDAHDDAIARSAAEASEQTSMNAEVNDDNADDDDDNTDADDESGFASSEGERTETTTTDDGAARHSLSAASSLSACDDEENDKENAAPALEAQLSLDAAAATEAQDWPEPEAVDTMHQRKDPRYSSSMTINSGDAVAHAGAASAGTAVSGANEPAKPSSAGDATTDSDTATAQAMQATHDTLHRQSPLAEFATPQQPSPSNTLRSSSRGAAASTALTSALPTFGPARV